LNFLGALPKSFLWVVIGYFFGQVSVIVIKYLKYGSYISIGIFALSIAVYFIIMRISRKYFKRFEV
jgi:membrane protein DedA with SNARE-associated domain